VATKTHGRKLTVKCPWCGRTVGFSKKGNLEPHMQSARVRCYGVGQPEELVRWLVASKAAQGESRKK
jgi:endogenous inhibitor of DNA gyrase (YacG/DUF329 family)